ncbi:hypothetical protein JMJ35_002388 [Cladonia borealis]|uniref:Major facilitator superfamily (MFS) profile domain-containing protein n=1 Tax=Cladonia borealis TaxID=184061 RepID=A0AA39V6U8_9LECA|nr:hypothetical protein JMJ35_002388 [Cladonia borealis]
MATFSQEVENGELSRSTSENNPNWDSPTPPVHAHTAAVNDAEATQPIVDEKPPKVDPNLVTWSGPDDPANPHNWSTGRKLAITGIWVYGNVVTTIASSIFSSGASQIEEEFHISSTVGILGISLFVLGYAIGPPIWGPMSERFGRKWPMFVGISMFTLFCLPVTLGRNIQTVLIGRFFCGVFGSAPLSIAGGALVDLWDSISRGVAMAACIGAIFGTPILAPIMGNFIAASYLGWRWDNWLSAIMGLACTFLVLFFLPETFGVVLLKQKAERVRKETGNMDAKCIYDGEKKDFKTIVNVYLVRPFVMLGLEPILGLVTIYQAFIYGILYLIFVSYPIAFREVRHFELGVSGLTYIGMLIGVFLGAATVIIHTRTRFANITRANKGVVIPEQRLPLMIVGGCILPIGLFIFAWTSDPNIPWIGMIIGSVPVGMGMFMVFVQCFNYLVDVYLNMANSAIGANTFVRSFFGAGFPLFGPAMYHRLGVAWATSLLGFLSIAMIPIPLLFYVYGRRIRSWSKMTANRN